MPEARRQLLFDKRSDKTKPHQPLEVYSLTALNDADAEVIGAIAEAVKEFWDRPDLRERLGNRIDGKLRLKIVQETFPPQS